MLPRAMQGEQGKKLPNEKASAFQWSHEDTNIQMCNFIISHALPLAHWQDSSFPVDLLDIELVDQLFLLFVFPFQTLKFKSTYEGVFCFLTICGFLQKYAPFSIENLRGKTGERMHLHKMLEKRAIKPEDMKRHICDSVLHATVFCTLFLFYNWLFIALRKSNDIQEAVHCCCFCKKTSTYYSCGK